MPHFDSTEPPQPPEPFLLDVADPEVAYPRFKRRLTLMERIDALEQSILELREQLAHARGFRAIGDSTRFEAAPDEYPARDGKGDDC